MLVRPGRLGVIGRTSRVLGIAAPAPAPWWHPDAIYERDTVNDRYYLNGVSYASKADFVASGLYSNVAGVDTVTLPALPTVLTMYAEGVTSTSSAPASAEYAWRLKGGGSDGQSNGFAYRTTDRTIRTEGRSAAGATTWNINGGAVNASTAVTIATRLKAGSIGQSVNGGGFSPVNQPLAAPYTKLEELNRAAGDRPWNGTMPKIALLNRDPSDDELKAIATEFLWLSAPALPNAITEPFQMEPSIVARKGDKAVIGYADRQGYACVVEIDLVRRRAVRAKRVYNWGTPDEHRTAVVKFLTDGSLVVAGTGHNSGNVIFFARSPSGAIADLPTATAFATNLNDPNYMSLQQASNGDLFILTNEDKVDGVNYRPNLVFFRLSSDFTTLSPCRPFTGRLQGATPTLGTNQIYQHHAQPSPDVALIYSVWHDNNPDAEFHLVEVNLSSGDVITRSLEGVATVHGNMFADTLNTLPITAYDATPIPWPRTAGKKQIELLLRDDGSAALVQEVNNSDNGSSVLWFYRLTGSNPFNPADWTKVATPFGAVFTDAAFARVSHSGFRVYYTRQNGAVYELIQADTADNGTSWQEVVLLTDAKELRRPVATDDPRFPVFCSRYTFRTSPVDFNSDLAWPA